MFFAICPVASDDEVPRLDPRGGGEVDLAALDRGAHDRPRRRVRRALQLLAQVRREGRQERGQLRRGRRTAGDLVAVAVPRLLGVTVVRRDPPAGRVQQVVGRRPPRRRCRPTARARASSAAPAAAPSSARPAGRASGPCGSRRRRPGSRPSVTSGTPISIRLSSATIRWWQASAISSPPPSAEPLIAATTGTPSVSSDRSCRLTSSIVSKTSAASAGWICDSSCRLPPAKNVDFALVITTRLDRVLLGLQPLDGRGPSPRCTSRSSCSREASGSSIVSVTTPSSLSQEIMPQASR